MINTKDIRGDVGYSLPILLTARDHRGQPISLVRPAVAYAFVLADLKTPPLFQLSSNDSLALGALGSGVLDTRVRGRMVSGSVGLPITVQLVGDSSTIVSVTNTNNAVQIHYRPGVSTVAQVESAISGSANDVCPIEIVTPGAHQSSVLQIGDALPRSLVTAVVILDQTTYAGKFVVTFVDARTSLLKPTGDSDPYFWNVSIVDGDLQPYSVVSTSRMSMFGASTPS